MGVLKHALFLIFLHENEIPAAEKLDIQQLSWAIVFYEKILVVDSFLAETILISRELKYFLCCYIRWFQL